MRLRCASCVGSSPHQHGLLVDFIHQRDHAHGGARIRAVAQPCIHAGRVERGCGGEDEREHPKQALSWKRDGDGRVRTRILSSRLSRCDPRVAQPCIHAGRVERGAAERERTSASTSKQALSRGRKRRTHECGRHLRAKRMNVMLVSYSMMKSAGYAPPCIWVQLLRTLGRVVHTPNGDTDVHGEPLACRCARTAPPPSCRHRAATCTATAAHRRPPPASVLSSVCC